MSLLVAAVACSTAPPGVGEFEKLPPGDIARGAALFNQYIDGAPSCIGCHSLDGQPGTGPTVKGYAALAGIRVGGLSAGDYTLQSIMRPAAFVVPGYPNAMFAQYPQRLNPQQLADLIAYLLTL